MYNTLPSVLSIDINVSQSQLHYHTSAPVDDIKTEEKVVLLTS